MKFFLALMLVIVGPVAGFVPSYCYSSSSSMTPPIRSQARAPSKGKRLNRKEDTSLSVLVDVPEHFFVLTFPILGLISSVSKSFGRLRMEERAWELRVEEARMKRLQEDPTLTEIELRRKEAALEWSAYGKPRMDEERAERERRELQNGRKRVKVMERDDDDADEEHRDDDREYRMSDKEIEMFEMEYGVEYDPYYDDPYSEDELPDDIPFNVDKKYGDRIYENGEIFYKDKESGLYFRQGAKPRNLSFWG
eukprot:scaffold481_cov208-Cylindrotheca_fusiformis.AAC.5